MLKFLLCSPRVQLHYQQEAPELNAQPICFPTTAGLLDRKQVQHNFCLLENLAKKLNTVTEAAVGNVTCIHWSTLQSGYLREAEKNQH